MSGTPKDISKVGDITSERPFKIGARAVGGDRFEGLIDDVRVYGRALTQNEVSALAKGGASPTAPRDAAERIAAIDL